MTLPGTIQSAPSGVSGFDTDTVLSAQTATQLRGAGFRFCVRYVSLDAPEPGDLSHGEALSILDAGLALMAVQHVRSAGWAPTGALGSAYGSAAATNARDVGFPVGVNVWCDLEGIASTFSADVVVSYCNAWYDAVSESGYVPGLYVGAAAVLTGEQLYYELKFQHYWKSASSVPNVAVRGYQLIQAGPDTTADGVEIDTAATQTDRSGGQVLWLTTATGA